MKKLILFAFAGIFIFSSNYSMAQGSGQLMLQYVQASVLNSSQDNVQLEFAAFFIDMGAEHGIEYDTNEEADTLNIQLYYPISTVFISRLGGFHRDTLNFTKSDSTGCLHARAFMIRNNSSAPGGLDTILRTDTVFCLNNLGISGFSNKKLHLMVSPNPVTDVLNIQTSGQERIINLELTDIAGRVLKIESGNNLTEMDIRTISPGIYFLKIETNDRQTAVYKIQKE